MPPKPRDFHVLASERSVQASLGVQISERRKTPSGYATSDDSFIRHDTYFFEDGNVTFLVGGTLYCVHRYFFSRDSVYFSTRLSQLDIRDHEALPSIISIGNIERNDFEALLSVLYPVNFETYELSYEQWRSVLHLSTLWGFASIRKLALKYIKPPTSHDQLVLARTYSVDQWVLPALAALCSRTLPLRLDEAREMSMEDVVLVATVREDIRGGTPRVDVADIPSHIEMALAEKLNYPMGNDAFWDHPKSGTTGQGSDSTAASGVNLNLEVEDTKAMKVLPSGPQQRSAKEGGPNTSDVECSLNGVSAESPGEDARQGVEQPHVVKGVPQACLEEVVATPAIQTRETPKSEETESEAVAWFSPEVQATFTVQSEGPMKEKLMPESVTKAEVAEEQTKVESAEDKKTIEAEDAGLHAMQAEEKIAEQRAMDEATRVGASVQHSSTASITPYAPPSMHPVNSITATPWWASVMPSIPTLGSHEREPVNDKLDGHTGEGKDDQTQNAAAALPAEALTEPTAPQLGHSSLASGGANITSTTSMSSSGTQAGDVHAPIVEDWSSVRLTKIQRKKMREKARKQAQMGEKNKSHPPSGESPNKVDNSTVQEYKPVVNPLPCSCSLCQRSRVSLAC